MFVWRSTYDDLKIDLDVLEGEIEGKQNAIRIKRKRIETLEEQLSAKIDRVAELANENATLRVKVQEQKRKHQNHNSAIIDMAQEIIDTAEHKERDDGLRRQNSQEEEANTGAGRTES